MSATKEYITVCDECGRKTWYETEQKCHCSYPRSKTCGECAHIEYFDDMVPCKGTLKIIDYSYLDQRFDYALKNDLRVEVEWKKGFEDFTGYGCRTDGKKARFRVGRSTGWKPIYLMILQSNSHGGGAILSSSVKSVRIL